MSILAMVAALILSVNDYPPPPRKYFCEDACFRKLDAAEKACSQHLRDPDEAAGRARWRACMQDAKAEYAACVKRCDKR